MGEGRLLGWVSFLMRHSFDKPIAVLWLHYPVHRGSIIWFIMVELSVS